MNTSIKAPGFGATLVALAAIGAALLALFVLGSPAVAGSTDLLVNTTADGADGACEQPVPVTNPDGDCTLREAIIRSNTSGADAIDIPAGTYKLTIKGRGEDSAATGDLDLRNGVTIRGDGARNTIISGNGIDRVLHTPFQGTSTAFHLNIFGVKITGGGALADEPGGGIFHDADDATLNLNQSTVSGNKSSDGGGIMAQRGPLNVTRSTISGNRAPDGLGGGILISGGGGLTLANSTISGNRSKFGGGIVTYEALNITDSTIAFNTAQQPGGGIFINSGTVTVKNAIVSNNMSDFANSKNCSGPVTSQGNNLEKGTSCGFTQTGDINAGPRLGALANNGGTTNTHALLRGSPAIDAAGFPFPPTDQRGVTRPQGAGSDIGSYEKF